MQKLSEIFQTSGGMFRSAQGVMIDSAVIPLFRSIGLTVCTKKTVRFRKYPWHRFDHSYHLSPVRELCFDLSRFNSKAYRLSDFVGSLISHEENESLLRYENVIKYAEFPALGLNPDDRETFGESLQVEHTEVFDILDWPKGKGWHDNRADSARQAGEPSRRSENSTTCQGLWG